MIVLKGPAVHVGHVRDPGAHLFLVRKVLDPVASTCTDLFGETVKALRHRMVVPKVSRQVIGVFDQARIRHNVGMKA